MNAPKLQKRLSDHCRFAGQALSNCDADCESADQAVHIGEHLFNVPLDSVNMIFSGTVIAKAGDEDLEMPIGEEAVSIAKQMTELRPQTIETASKAFGLKPIVESIRNPLVMLFMILDLNQTAIFFLTENVLADIITTGKKLTIAKGEYK